MQCLLIETPDKRKFFTHEKNYSELIEFSKTFKASISLVNVDHNEVLCLEELAPMICDQTKSQAFNYVILEHKMQNQKNRKSSIENANNIRNYIKNELSYGNTVSLKDLKDKYSHYGLSDSCLCNHFKFVRESMEKNGIKLEKTGGGKYRIVNHL